VNETNLQVVLESRPAQRVESELRFVRRPVPTRAQGRSSSGGRLSSTLMRGRMKREILRARVELGDVMVGGAVGRSSRRVTRTMSKATACWACWDGSDSPSPTAVAS